MNDKLVSTVRKYLGISQKYSRDVFSRIFEARVAKTKKFIDDSFHISAVQQAQTSVTNAEQRFLDARKLTSEVKDKLEVKETALEEAKKKVDRCPRENANFLALVSEEHSIQMQMKDLRRLHKNHEQNERDLFTEYSNSVRSSHEEERERAQKTKYWSIIGSVSGAVIGFLGSSLITYYRLKQIKEMTSPSIIIKSFEVLQHEIQNQHSKNFENTSRMVEGVLKQLSHESGLKNSRKMDNEYTYSVLDQQRKEIELKLEEVINEKTDNFIQSVNRLLDEFQQNVKKLFDEKKNEFQYNMTEHLDLQRTELQGFLLKNIKEMAKNETLEAGEARNNITESGKRKEDLEISSEERIRNDNAEALPDHLVFNTSWKQDMCLGATVASLALLLYLINAPKS